MVFKSVEKLGPSATDKKPKIILSKIGEEEWAAG